MVHRLLVTADEDRLTAFHLTVCMRLNDIERYDQTILYTCVEEDFQYAIKMARELGCTLEEHGPEGRVPLHAPPARAIDDHHQAGRSDSLWEAAGRAGKVGRG